MTVKLSWYLIAKFSRVPFTIVLIPLTSTMVNSTLLNFGKRYEDDFRIIFDQWPKLHLGLDALRNQKILKGVYYGPIVYKVFFNLSIRNYLAKTLMQYRIMHAIS